MQGGASGCPISWAGRGLASTAGGRQLLLLSLGGAAGKDADGGRLHGVKAQEAPHKGGAQRGLPRAGTWSSQAFPP